MIRADMEELATILDALPGVMATTDPRKATNNRPCFLIAPPTIDQAGGSLAGPLYRHRIVALASKNTGSLDALDELDTLVAAAWDTLPIETAAPGVYPLGNDRVPCYVLTMLNT